MITSIITYFLGVGVGMIVMSVLLKSRVFYHLNTFDLFNTLNMRPQKEKLRWML
tara:strand:- start:1701 stop:1862 length:162 start_codon:yes stop_codon:yes gene_type:complete